MDKVLSQQEITHMMRELLVGLRSFTNTNGVMLVEPSIRYGSPDETSSTYCSHDFSDPTTWYQRSQRHLEETPTTSDHFSYQLAHFPVINGNSYKLYGRENAMPMPDSSFTGRAQFQLEIKINGNTVLQNDVNYAWTINYMTGQLIFTNRIPNDDIVTVNYSAISEQDPFPSRYILKPPTGKMLVVEHVEIQFSETVIINDDIVFSLWAGLPIEQSPAYGLPQYVNSPMNPWRQSYRCAHDFVNNGNEGQGYIAPFGGTERGLSSNTLVFPFKYIQAFPVESKWNSELHIELAHNLPYGNADIATCSFYTSLKDQR